jgi:hypothetical protein
VAAYPTCVPVKSQHWQVAWPDTLVQTTWFVLSAPPRHPNVAQSDALPVTEAHASSAICCEYGGPTEMQS